MNPVYSPVEPLVFEPIYQDRVWGGRTLETKLGRGLPDPGVPYGESWEICDRPEANSRIARGPLAGQTLGEIWQSESRRDIFGPAAPLDQERFPVLCKILDAREKLSLQVHPPAAVAPSLGGEPKTEMWYVAHADLGAKLYVGLRSGASRDDFERALEDGTAEDLVHQIPVMAGEFIFIPSGRLHAIGAGLLIYEIQQNSDTTYRVFDWNRVGLDGKPRDLHIEESLRSIDFDDIEPSLDRPNGSVLVDCDHFRVESHEIPGPGVDLYLRQDQVAIITIVRGEVVFGGQNFRPGDFFLIPSAIQIPKQIAAVSGPAKILMTTWPE